MTFVRCQDSGVSDCQILDPLHRGIELEDCVRCRIANNTIVDRRAQPTMRHAIRIVGQSRDNLISGNILGGAVETLLDGARESIASARQFDAAVVQSGALTVVTGGYLSSLRMPSIKTRSTCGAVFDDVGCVSYPPCE